MAGVDMGELPRAVFFDWDGTLVDTLPWLLSAHNHVRGRLGLALWTEAEFKVHMRFSSRELYGPLYGERAEEALSILFDFMERNHLESLNVLPGAGELLQRLCDLGIATGIVSNKRHEFLLKEVAKAGMDGLTLACVGAGFAQKDKPAADPLLRALDIAAVRPGADVWYVGDSETDMLTAQAAGCSPVLIRHGHDNFHLADLYAPVAVFDDCRAMCGRLRKAA